MIDLNFIVNLWDDLNILVFILLSVKKNTQFEKILKLKCSSRLIRFYSGCSKILPRATLLLTLIMQLLFTFLVVLPSSYGNKFFLFGVHKLYKKA